MFSWGDLSGLIKPAAKFVSTAVGGSSKSSASGARSGGVPVPSVRQMSTDSSYSGGDRARGLQSPPTYQTQTGNVYQRTIQKMLSEYDV